jgi:hypothetical protein
LAWTVGRRSALSALSACSALTARSTLSTCSARSTCTRGSAGSGLFAGVLRVGQAMTPLPVVRAWRALITIPMVVLLLVVVSGGAGGCPGRAGSSRPLRAATVRSGSNFA